MRTAFTERFGVEHPLVQAGMGVEAGAALAAAVSNAGALGSIGSIGGTPDVLAEAIRACRAATSRPFAVNGAPFSVTDPSRPYDSRQDIQFTDEQVTVKPMRVAMWTFTLRNTNKRVAFRDVLYQTHYRDESGKIVDQRHEVIKNIFQPGTETRLTLNDGMVGAPFASATIEVLRAEALLPAER